MTLNKWDPWRELLNFQARAGRLIDATAEQSFSKYRAKWCPPVDVLETEDSYIFLAELPGVGKPNISIEVLGNRLTLYGHRPKEDMSVNAIFHTIERIHGYFERSFDLLGPVDLEDAEATYIDGILTLRIPKGRQAADRCITVQCLR
jgi:HSP20 family protein